MANVMLTATVGMAVRLANVNAKNWSYCVIQEAMLPCFVQTNRLCNLLGLAFVSNFLSWCMFENKICLNDFVTLHQNKIENGNWECVKETTTRP